MRKPYREPPEMLTLTADEACHVIAHHALKVRGYSSGTVTVNMQTKVTVTGAHREDVEVNGEVSKVEVTFLDDCVRREEAHRG